MKKKILMLAIAACLVVLSIAGSSLAYFTDIKEATNVFTSGKGVAIALNYDADAAKNTVRYPGQTYSDAATISLDAESEDAYVGAIIELSKANLKSIMTAAGEQDNVPAAISYIFSGLNANTVKYVEDTNSCKIYVVFTNKLTQANKTATIFSGIQIPAEWNKTQMDVFNGMEITVTAYAVQTVGFDGADAAVTALTSAFEVWKDNYPTT